MGPGRESGAGGCWGAGRVTCRLCGPRSFLDLLPSLIQFPLCREPNKWRTSGTRRVLGGVRFPILFAPALTAVSVSIRTRVPASPRAPRARPGGLGILAPPTAPPQFPRAGGLGGSRQPAPGGLGCGWAPSSAGAGLGAVGRPPLPSERALHSPAGGVGRLAGRGARFPAGTGLWEGPLRRKCQPSWWLLPLAPWAAAPSREGKSEMEETPLPTRQSSS